MYHKVCNKCFEEKEEHQIRRSICKDCEELEAETSLLSGFSVDKQDWRHREAFDFSDVLDIDFDWE